MTAKTDLRRSVGVLSAIGLVGALVTASAASGLPHTDLHLSTTLHLVSHPTDDARLSSTRQVVTSSLVSRGNGRAAGAAVYTCRVVGSDLLSCKSAYALKGGILLGRETIDLRSQTLTGKITGGNGSYSGSSGSIKGVGRRDGGVNLTVTFSG